MSQVFVTSKGPRNPSQIVHVEGGSRVRQTHSGRETIAVDAVEDKRLASHGKQPTGGWQSWSTWTNRTSTGIVSFVGGAGRIALRVRAPQ
jgi:hypothetical protein